MATKKDSGVDFSNTTKDRDIACADANSALSFAYFSENAKPAAAPATVFTTTTAPRLRQPRPQDIRFPQSLHEPFASILNKVLTAPSLSGIDETNNNSTVSARLDELEIELRRHALALAQIHKDTQFQKKDQTNSFIESENQKAFDTMDVDAESNTASSRTCESAMSLSALGNYWKTVLLMCAHLVCFGERVEKDKPENDTDIAARYKGMDAVRKVPMIVLEDILDCLPILSCHEFWICHVEPAADILFSKLIWDPVSLSSSSTQRPCWVSFLRLCNNLLRRSSPQSAARIMLTLATVYPLSEKSAVKVWGSRNTNNVVIESKQEFDQQQIEQTEMNNGIDVDDDDGTVPDYSFYESFWSLQRDFSSPFVKNVAIFLQRLRTLLQAMENNNAILTLTRQVTAASNTDPSAVSTATTATASSIPVSSLSCTIQQPLFSLKSSFFPATYLSSSRLLSIQLSSDPDFCIHVLTQFLIVAHHFATEAPRLGDQLLDLQQRAKSCLSKLTTPRTGGLMIENQQHTLGQQHLQMLEYILTTSESQWRHWKKNKCQPALDQKALNSSEQSLSLSSSFLDDTISVASSVTSPAQRKRKRLADGAILATKRDAGGGNLYHLQKMRRRYLVRTAAAAAARNNKTGTRHDVHDLEDSGYRLLELRKEIPEISQEMKQLKPSIESHLSEYVDALDPESGIEPEFHPKNNVFFNWQALRLLSTESLQHFGHISPDGDFEPMIRYLHTQEKGVSIPGIALIYDEIDQEEKIEPEMEEEATVATATSAAAEEDGTAADTTTVGGTEADDEEVEENDDENMLDEGDSLPTDDVTGENDLGKHHETETAADSMKDNAEEGETVETLHTEKRQLAADDDLSTNAETSSIKSATAAVAAVPPPTHKLSGEVTAYEGGNSDLVVDDLQGKMKDELRRSNEKQLSPLQQENRHQKSQNVTHNAVNGLVRSPSDSRVRSVPRARSPEIGRALLTDRPQVRSLSNQALPTRTSYGSDNRHRNDLVPRDQGSGLRSESVDRRIVNVEAGTGGNIGGSRHFDVPIGLNTSRGRALNGRNEREDRSQRSGSRPSILPQPINPLPQLPVTASTGSLRMIDNDRRDMERREEPYLPRPRIDDRREDRWPVDDRRVVLPDERGGGGRGDDRRDDWRGGGAGDRDGRRGGGNGGGGRARRYNSTSRR